MPDTEVGKRHPVWPDGPDCDESCPGDWSTYHDGYSWGYEKAVAAERDRIRAAVEGLPAREGMEYADEYQTGWADHRAAVLRIVEGEGA